MSNSTNEEMKPSPFHVAAEGFISEDHTVHNSMRWRPSVPNVLEQFMDFTPLVSEACDDSSESSL